MVKLPRRTGWDAGGDGTVRLSIAKPREPPLFLPSSPLVPPLMGAIRGKTS